MLEYPLHLSELTSNFQIIIYVHNICSIAVVDEVDVELSLFIYFNHLTNLNTYSYTKIMHKT